MEEQAVGRSEAGPMDLAFKDAELVAQSENLDLKCGFGLPAEDKEVEQSGRWSRGGPESSAGIMATGRGRCRRSRCQAIIGGRITGDNPLS